MKKNTYLHIQEPCHENWSSMTAAEKGRFCQSCSKTVTDFSTMTDRQVLEFLAKAPIDTCGRFSNDQLNREIHFPATPAKKTVWGWILSAMLPLFIAGRSEAQKKMPAKQRTEQRDGSAGKMATLPGQHMTDTLQPVNSTRDTDMEKADAYQGVTMGLIVQYDKVKATDTITTYVKKAIKNDLFSVYPNPATKGKKISVQVNKAGDYSMQLLDMDSRMITYKTIKISKAQVVFLDIPSSIASGTYYLRLAKAGPGSQFVEKIVVK